MSAEATVRGKVVGEPGKPVAGWVSLGPNQPQRWIAYDVRIKTDAGQEVALEGLTAGTIEPVLRTKAPWRELARHELAKLCLAEAPAPDVEVVFTTAVLRGGEPVMAWGKVIRDEDDDEAKAPYRSETAIHRLAVLAIGRGDDPDYALNQSRARYEDAQREQEYVRAKRATAEQSTSPAPVPPNKYPPAPRRSSAMPLAVGLAAIVAAAAAYVLWAFVL